MNDGIGIRDMRIGFKAYYGDNWYFRGDASFTNNKVSLKDVYLQYSFNKNNFIRAGHYTLPFGLSSAYSSAIYRASTPSSQRLWSTHWRDDDSATYIGRRADLYWSRRRPI